MDPQATTEDIYEERITRYLDLAENAQEAAGRASTETLKETYAKLAQQWVDLARMAQRTIDLARSVAKRPRDNDRRNPPDRRMH